jgi:methylmalonyl-CoA epimerase
VRVEGFDHVGILVADFDDVRRVFGDLLGLELRGPELEPHLGVEILWVDGAGVPLEFIRPVDPESRAGQRLAAGEGGVHHVAFAVNDTGAALEEARAAGVATLDDVPRRGAHGMLIGFLAAEAVAGTRVEFVQVPEEARQPG